MSTDTAIVLLQIVTLVAGIVALAGFVMSWLIERGDL